MGATDATEVVTALYETKRRMLLAWCHTVGVGDVAEDLVHGAFLELLRRWPVAFEPAAFLFFAMKRGVRDEWRRRHHFTDVMDGNPDDERSFEERFPHPGPGPAAVAVVNEQAVWLSRGLATLSAEQVALLDRVAAGVSVRAIAVTEGMTERRVRRLVDSAGRTLVAALPR